MLAVCRLWHWSRRGPRQETAETCEMDRQTLRDWLIRYSAKALCGLLIDGMLMAHRQIDRRPDDQIG